MIDLTHPFLRRCINRHALLDKIYKFNTFASRLEKQAKQYGGKGKDKEEKINTYKGWGFELFGEALVKMFAFDKRVGISNYCIGEEDEDIGVDGYGVGSNGNPATVQLKYRQADYELTANNDHLTNFTHNSTRVYKVIDECNMLIITCGKGLHWHTQQNMLGPAVRCLNREKIRVLVDNNKSFWDEFRSAWEKAVT